MFCVHLPLHMDHLVRNPVNRLSISEVIQASKGCCTESKVHTFAMNSALLGMTCAKKNWDPSNDSRFGTHTICGAAVRTHEVRMLFSFCKKNTGPTARELEVAIFCKTIFGYQFYCHVYWSTHCYFGTPSCQGALPSFRPGMMGNRVTLSFRGFVQPFSWAKKWKLF